MKKIIFVFLAAVFAIAGFCRVEKSEAAGPTYPPYFIETPTTWTKEGSPYVIGRYVIVYEKLTIEPGTVVKFHKDAYLRFGNPTKETVSIWMGSLFIIISLALIISKSLNLRKK